MVVKYQCQKIQLSLFTWVRNTLYLTYRVKSVNPCRYVAIIHPLKQRMSSTQTKVVVAVVWTLALLLAFPQYYYSTTTQLPDRVVCFIDWPDYAVCDFRKM